jgi:hypothetical protein
MRTRHILAVTLFLFAAPTLEAQAGRHLNTQLTITVGDYGALILPAFLGISDLNHRVAVTYEPIPGVIDVEIFGRWATVESARQTIGQYWELIQQVHIPYIQRRFGVSLGASNYRIIYYDRTARGGPRIIVQFVNGQFLIE